MATWPFRRSRDAAPSPSASGGDVGDAGPAGAVAAEPPGWASLPALSGSFRSPSPTFKTGATVAEDLVAWRSPRLSGAMGHAVSPDGPSGHVAGLLTPVPGASAGAGSAAGQRRADVDLVLATPPGDSDLPGPMAPRVLPADTTFSAPARPVEAPAPTMPLRRLPVVSHEAGPTAPTGDHDLAPPGPAGPAIPAADLPVQRAPEATADPAGSSSPRPEITADMADLAIFQRPRRDRPADTPSVQRLPDATAGLDLPVARPSTAGDSSTGDAPAMTPGESPSSAGTTDTPLVAPRGVLPGGEQPGLSGPTTGPGATGGSAAPVVQRRPVLGEPLATSPASRPTVVQRHTDDLIDRTGAIPVPSALPLGTGTTLHGDPATTAPPPVDRSALQHQPLIGAPGSASLPLYAPSPGSAPPQQRDLLGNSPAAPLPQGTSLQGDDLADSSRQGEPPSGGGAASTLPLSTSLQRELLAGGGLASASTPNAPGQDSLLGSSGSSSAVNQPGEVGGLAGGSGSTMPLTAPGQGRHLAGAPGPTMGLGAPGRGELLASGPGTPLQREPSAGSPGPTLLLSTSSQRGLLGGDGPGSPSSLGAVVAPSGSTSGSTALPPSAPRPGDSLATQPLQRERSGYRAVPMDLQQAAVPAATTVGTAPGLTYTTTLQRSEDTAAAPPPPPQEPVREVTLPAPPPAEAPAPAPEAPAAEPATATPTDLDDLAHKLYDRIRWRLRAELRRDMERAGLGAGVRR